MDFKRFSLTRKFTLSIILVCFLYNLSFNQALETGTPFIQNFSPRDYGFENHNYSIVQDKRGFIYVGSLNGIIEYDGHFWNHIEIRGEIQLAVSEEGDIFVGAYDDFGILQHGFKNKLEFRSIAKDLDKDDKSFGHIKKVVTIDNEALFISDKNIYLWDGNTIRKMASTYTYFRTFKVKNKIYVYKNLDGLYSIRSNSLVLVPEGDFFVDKEILEIVPLENGMLIKTAGIGSPYLYSENGIEVFKTEADEFFDVNGFTKGIRLENNNYAIGTERCGIVFLNKFGKVVGHINKSNGLIDDKVNDMYIDHSGHLWLATSNGISRLEYPSKFSFFDSGTGMRGAINTITRHENNIYIGTTQGVFFLNQNFDIKQSCISTEIFLPVRNVNANCRHLLSIDNKLLVATNNGMFEIKNKRAIRILEGDFNFILNSKINSSLYYLAKNKSISAMTYYDGRWTELGDLENLNKKIRTIYETENGMLWLGSEHHGAFVVNVSNGYDIYNHVSQYKTGSGLSDEFDWLDIYETSFGPLFSTKNGLYKFDNEKQAFYPDSILGSDYAGGNHSIYKLTQTENGDIWFSSGSHEAYHSIIGLAKINADNKTYELSSYEFNRINNYKIEAIYSDQNNITWLGGYDGLIRYDANIQDAKIIEDATYIRKILLKKDSVFAYGINNLNVKDKLPEIINQYNSILFEYASPNYESIKEVLYQHILEGYEKNWSEWTSSHLKEYTNLKRGKYLFKVRAKNKFGQITNEAIFEFKILPSLFTSFLAFLYYLIVAASFFYMLSKWRAYRFAKERFELEQIINVRTEELAFEKEKAYELFAKATSEDELSNLIVQEKEKSQRFKMVTVLITELSGFDSTKEKENKEVLNKIFKYFDVVSERNHLQKIKVNDSKYVCVGGIPEPSKISPVNISLAALEMSQHIEDLNNDENSKIGHKIFVQSGIHTGPVAALISGKNNTPYDLQGETINIAERILSSCEIGKVSISSISQKLLQDFFICNYTEKLQVKFIGEIERFVIDGIKPNISENGEGLKTNADFNIAVALLRFSDLRKFVINKMEVELPANQHFHNIKHTYNFINQVSTIAVSENTTTADLLALKTASLFYNIGFIKAYSEHAVKSLKLGKEILPGYGYNNEQIKVISDLIYAVKTPPEPKNKLEKIICDAYFDYLGSQDFNNLSRNLFRELLENKKTEDDYDKWNTKQLAFLEKHEYFTDTSKKLRNGHKEKTINNLKNHSTHH